MESRVFAILLSTSLVVVFITEKAASITYLFFILFYFILFYFAHTNNYNTLHLQFITVNCYRLQKKRNK